MKIIFEKVSEINFLPIINFIKIGNIFYITFGIHKYLLHFRFGKSIFDGHYSSASDNSRIQINTTTSSLSLASFVYGGSVKDDATYSVYYR